MEGMNCVPLMHHMGPKVARHDAEMLDLEADTKEVFKDTPTYMKELYGLASEDSKRLSLLHNGDSVRSFFDEGKHAIRLSFLMERV